MSPSTDLSCDQILVSLISKDQKYIYQYWDDVGDNFLTWFKINAFQITLQQNKEDKIYKREHRSKNATSTTFNYRKLLKGWIKIPIRKQIEDEERDRKQTQHNEK